MTSEVVKKLPKNIVHWAKSRGLKVSFNWKNEQIYFTSTKKEFTKNTSNDRRNFRITSRVNEFEICDGYFDRWANSSGHSVSVPHTREEFNKSLDELVAKAEIVSFSEEVLKIDLERDLEYATDKIEFAKERYGYIVDWCNKYGFYDKYDRKCVRNYHNILKKEYARMRKARKHYNYKMAEIAALNKTN